MATEVVMCKVIVAEIMGDGSPYLEDITNSTILLRETSSSNDKRAVIHVFDSQEEADRFCIGFRVENMERLEAENMELKRLLFEVTHSEEHKKLTEPLWIPVVHKYIEERSR